MRLLSVNIGQPQSIQDAKASGQTGIYKLPVCEPVEITDIGLVGDAICDSENHGGVDQAVYVYGLSDYEWWAKALGRELPPGIFGENLTITNLESSQIYIGGASYAPRLMPRTAACTRSRGPWSHIRGSILGPVREALGCRL